MVGAPTAFSGTTGSFSDYLLLDPPITVMLLMLLSLTLLLGCSPLSMYALNKLSAFLTKNRTKYMRELPSARSYIWSFYPHVSCYSFLLFFFIHIFGRIRTSWTQQLHYTVLQLIQLAALATLLAVAASAAPLLHDFSRMYKLNPHPVLLAAGTFRYFFFSNLDIQ